RTPFAWITRVSRVSQATAPTLESCFLSDAASAACAHASALSRRMRIGNECMF
ncbi:hypothetical protein NDU88_007964, partial [Pleurodeles waltl]